MEPKKENIMSLIERGLSEEESKTFLDLLNKIKLTDEDINGFYQEMEEGIPFEGGMGFTEALTGLKEAMPIETIRVLGRDFTVTDIQYDTDGEEIDLPMSITITVPENVDDEDIEQYLSDEISNITGFCHKGFVIEGEEN